MVLCCHPSLGEKNWLTIALRTISYLVHPHDAIVQAYVIGIVFSLHTHVDMVWDKQHDKKPPTGLAYYQKLMPGHIISHLVHHPQEQADYQPNGNIRKKAVYNAH